VPSDVGLVAVEAQPLTPTFRHLHRQKAMEGTRSHCRCSGVRAR
jgi:hypothetical protein